MDRPRAGVHYPRSVGEFQAWFGTDDDCLDYLEWLRWPRGFVCPRCGYARGWRMSDGRFRCASCDARTSVTAGTIFDRTRTPLTVWFTVCWMFASGKDGVSALSVQRTLEIGSYQTAWAMLHRLRSVLVRPGRDRLAGTVEVDETYIGGEEPGLRGGRARGKKVLTGIAVEVSEPKGIGRARMAPLHDASLPELHAFVTDHVAPGATVITDGWSGYTGLDQLGYVHDRRSQRAARPAARIPVNCCPPCTELPRWPKGGCWALTRVRPTRRTCPATWTSSCSDSTVAAPAAEAWCSTESSSSPSPTRRSATKISLSIRSPKRHRQCHRAGGGIRRPWNGHQRTAHGEPLTWTTPVKWIPPNAVLAALTRSVSMAKQVVA